MQPTLMGRTRAPDGQEKPGDSFMVDKLRYRFSEPQRGDIVMFKTTGLHLPGLSENQVYVKRLVGLPGEKVSIQPPFVCVNGNRIMKPEVFEKIASGADGYSGFSCTGLLASASAEVLLGKDEYFVLGDNTVNSFDGRHFGPIRRDSIIGRVAWVYAPSERKGWLR
jgi:signal peptidase I